MADMPRPRRQQSGGNPSQPEDTSPKGRYAGDTQPMNVPPDLYANPTGTAGYNARSAYHADGYDPYDTPSPEPTGTPYSNDWQAASAERIPDSYDPYDTPYPAGQTHYRHYPESDPAAQRDYGIPDGYDPYDMPRTRRRRKALPADYRPPRAAYENTAQKSRPARRRKHRRHRFLGGLLRSVLAVLFVAFAAYSAISLALISKLDQVARAPRSVASGTLGNTNYTRSILLIGTDSRNLLRERGRSDSMILLTFNDAAHAVYMTSFLRDTYVEIPNRGFGKLNAAYSYGGPELLMDTLEQNFDLSIDDYICISFMGFADIIDSFGGVEISLTNEEAEAINGILKNEVNALMGDDPASDLLPSGGNFLLTGKQALSYARIRYVGNADFERTSRQRDVMQQLVESAKQRAVQSVPNLLSSAKLHISTNMTTSQLYLLSLRFPLATLYQTRQQQIPANGTWADANIDGAAVLQVDTAANRRILKETTFAQNLPPED